MFIKQVFHGIKSAALILKIPKIKQASMKCKWPPSPLAKTVKAMPSVKQIMANVFWECKSVLIVDFLDCANNTTTECYHGTLDRL